MKQTEFVNEGDNLALTAATRNFLKNQWTVHVVRESKKAVQGSVCSRAVWTLSHGMPRMRWECRKQVTNFFVYGLNCGLGSRTRRLRPRIARDGAKINSGGGRKGKIFGGSQIPFTAKGIFLYPQKIGGGEKNWPNFF